MIKRLVYACIFLCIALLAEAQPYGNEWINYSQKYFKFPVVKTGIYRVDSTALANAGIPLSTISPRNLQIFIKGQEQYVFIQGESDDVFNANDYIELYAEKNDCTYDSLAYMGIPFLPNPYVALWNDTNYVYITWNGSLNNRRVSVETDVAFTGYTPASYINYEIAYSIVNYYSPGATYFDGISDPRYVTGEGYGLLLNKGQNYATSLGNIRLYQSPALTATIGCAFSGTSNDFLSGQPADHEAVFQYDNGSGPVTFMDTLFQGFSSFRVYKQIPSTQLSTFTNFNFINVNNAAFANATSGTMFHYIYFRYPQAPNFGGVGEETFDLPDDPLMTKAYLSISGVGYGGNTPVFYDLSNHRQIPVVATGGTVEVLVPNSGTEKKCILTHTGNILNINSAQIRPVNQSGYFVDYKTGITDSAFVIVTHSSLASSAQQYKLYRQSISGGSHNVILAFVDDLYDQFAYGNTKNPLAIRQFCRFLVDSLPSEPRYLLLLGKGIKHTDVRNGAAYWNASLVPSIGVPASDNLFTAGFKNSNTAVPYIPTGRIAAKNDSEVMHYLNKLVQYNATGPEEWRKHVIHFAGGTDAGQQAQFESYLHSYEHTIRDTLYGGTVFNFQKTTTAPIQITVSDSVKHLINEGASLITFFGHGSISGFDQAIDDPSIYSNTGKYPLLIANSCYSGDIHTLGANSTSENFTLIDQKGTIAFIASSSIGLTYPLDIFSSELYKNISYKNYYRGIGDCVKSTCTQNTIDYSTDIHTSITDLEMTLHGDPAVRLMGYRYPDYSITNSSVFFNTTSFVDSIGIGIDITNLGKAVNDTFVVRIERYFPTGDSATFLKKIKAPLYRDTLSFFILKDYTRGVGLNHFKVFVDSYNQIVELSESNNSTIGSVDLFISGGDVVPVYPYKYAIVPTAPQITLKASTADPFAAQANYRIQLDTNDTFIAPITTTLTTSVGGVIEWTVNLPFADSTVYFWRISKDSVLPTDHLNWRESSFQTINNRHGWAQAHFHQFKNDTYRFVKYKKPQRHFDFANDVTSIECKTGFLNAIGWDQIHYSLNNSVKHIWTCGQDGWSIVVFDSTSAEPWQTLSINSTLTPGSGQYGNCQCTGTQQILYAFDFGAQNYCGFVNWQDSLEYMLSQIPPNNKVLAYTQQNHHSQSYSSSLYYQFTTIGGDVQSLPDTVPMIIFGRKSSVPTPGQATQVIGANKSSVIQLNDSIQTNWSSGYIASEIIGPSFKWNEFHWQQVPVELPNKDSVVVKIVGIQSNGQRDTLATFPVDSAHVYDLYNYADANTYPYMQLVAMMHDQVYKTPPQMKKWQIIYDLPPECAINPKDGYVLVNDSLQEGDNLVVHLPIENIGTLPFTDSLVVTYWLEDKDRINHYLPSKMKAKPFVPGQVIMDTVQFNSLGYPGLNYMWVDVNPPANSKYQKEQYHFNNIARIPFSVSTDKVNPLLDVTFDGVHILNGDIISAKPHILVTLKDENQFLALNDTNDFVLYLKKPSDAQEKKIFFAQGLQFTPAQLPKNSCKIEWSPGFTDDGKYLFIVQAKDRSNNASGAVDYRIQFEIVTRQTITEVLNYPNPFSTSTRFVFTLTGSEIPDIFTIQIMTISGKIVKEITKEQLGFIHIGRNITQYAWDGKDDFGDKLANGVYLYRVITRQNGQAVEKQQTDADQFFKKDWGKMVIIR
ncbi:MAG: hypothetical protein JST26_02540 [Bacteroidetes bacterium]|nr:hypothetical protein [Bacteroidota bacterium]